MMNGYWYGIVGLLAIVISELGGGGLTSLSSKPLLISSGINSILVERMALLYEITNMLK